MKKIRFRFFSGPFFYLISDGLPRVSKLLLYPFYFKFLSLDLIGSIFVFESIVVLIEPFFSFGLQYSISRFLPENSFSAKRDTFLSEIYTLKLMGGLFLITFVLLVVLVLNTFHLIDNYQAITILFAVLTSFFGSFTLIIQHYCIATVNPSLLSKVNFINFLITFSTSLCLVLFFGNYFSLIFGALVSSILFFIYLTFRVLRVKSFQYKFVSSVIVKLCRLQYRKLLSFSFPFIFHNLSILSLAFSDRVILSYYDSKAQIAVYGLSYQIVSILTILGVAYKNSYTAKIYSLSQETDKVRFYFSAILKKGFIFSVLLILFLFFFVQFFRLYEYQFYDLIKPYLDIQLILFPGMLFCLFYILSEPIVIMFQKSFQLSILIFFAALFNFFYNIYHIPLTGVYGAAYGTSFSYFIILIGVSFIIIRSFKNTVPPLK